MFYVLFMVIPIEGNSYGALALAKIFSLVLIRKAFPWNRRGVCSFLLTNAQEKTFIDFCKIGQIGELGHQIYQQGIAQAEDETKKPKKWNAPLMLFNLKHYLSTR